MTQRQETYMRQLAQEREAQLRQIAQSGDTRADTAKAWWLLRFLADGPTTPQLTVRQASDAISWMLSLPRPDAAAADEHGDAVDVPAGRYAIVTDDGTVKFYKVDRPTEGRWSGYTFVKVQASDEWHQIRDRHSRNAILRSIAADPIGAMRRYGMELGQCGNCGRTLTDETSRQMGIGPDCAQALGLDRSPYAEAARQERAARVRAVYEAPSEDEVYELAERLDIHPDEARTELAIERAEAIMDADDLQAERI